MLRRPDASASGRRARAGPSRCGLDFGPGRHVARSRSSVASGAVWFAIPPLGSRLFRVAAASSCRGPRGALLRSRDDFGPPHQAAGAPLHGCEPASEACRFGGRSTGQRTSAGLRAHVNAALRRGRDSCRTRLTFEHLGRSPRSLLFGGDRRLQPSTGAEPPFGDAEHQLRSGFGPDQGGHRAGRASASAARGRFDRKSAYAPGASGLRARPPRVCICRAAPSDAVRR